MPINFDERIYNEGDWWNCGLDALGGFPADEEIIGDNEFKRMVDRIKNLSTNKDLRMIVATTMTAYQKKAAKALKASGFKKVAVSDGMHGTHSGNNQLWVKILQKAGRS